MTETEKYNGWTNYETWNVALWIDNEQGSYRYWRGVTQECWDEAEPTNASKMFSREENAAFALSDRLKEEIHEQWQEVMEAAGKHVHMESSMWADLMGAALSEVNWREIADNWLEDVDKAEADPTDEEQEATDDATE